MGSNTTKAELRKSLNDLFASKDESQQHALLKQLIESNLSIELIMEVLTVSDVESLIKENFDLYKKLTLDVILFLLS